MKVVSVGKIREKYVWLGVCEYLRRLNSFTRIQWIEIKDSGKDREGEEILEEVGGDYVVVLDVCGRQLSSEEFAVFLRKNADKKICFVVGGPEGLSDKVLERADYRLSLSKMTFTHEMCRLFLLEQIYRAYMINSGRSYHK